MAKKLKLTNWRAGEFFGRQGINFDVMLEDGKENDNKQFTVTSRRLIAELKPILIRAESNNRQDIAVSILRTGEGQNTGYTVQELPPSFKELFR